MTLTPKAQDRTRRRDLFDRRIREVEARGKHFKRWLDKMGWPEREVWQFLRYSPVLSFRSLYDEAWFEADCQKVVLVWDVAGFLEQIEAFLTWWIDYKKQGDYI